MKKIILFSSIACALTACGGDGADPVPRTEPLAVSGKLTYTDESGKVVGELRGEELVELELGATDNQSFGSLAVRLLQQKEASPEFLPLVVIIDSQQNTQKPNSYSPLMIIQKLSKNIGGSNLCSFSDPDTCNAELLVDSNKGKIEWKQINGKLQYETSVPDTTPKDGVTLDINKPKYFYVSGSLISTIPPTSLVFQKDRFPVRGITSTLKDSELGDISFTQIEYEYKYPELSSLPVIPPPSEMHLILYGQGVSLDLNVSQSSLVSYRSQRNMVNTQWICVENCGFQLIPASNGQRISLQKAKLRHENSPEQIVELNGAIDFKPHNVKLSLKKESINSDNLRIATFVSNNTARYTTYLPTTLGASACSSGKEVIIERENQTIKSVEVTCDHWNSVTKTNVQTIFGVCGLPNTPTCTGASLSADGHTFTFVKTKLSNNEELNGTLYFAGVAAADPAVTTP